MSEKYAVVITTINHPTTAVIEIAHNAKRLEADFILVGDKRTPPDFRQSGSIYLDLEQQRLLSFSYARIAPAQHYARKNIGYLAAIKNGATIIVETDDDNIPRDGFWQPRQRTILARVVRSTEWINVYEYYAERLVWPRGFPLDRITQPAPSYSDLPREVVNCPIQQGLADENPDVDAIYRLVLPLPIRFRSIEPVALRGAWCPFNSQNTTWWREAFPLLYLPYHCSFRMTDIWRSFVAQHIAYLNGWSVLFHSATVLQERNEHNLLRDFEEEIPGYLYNSRIRSALESLDVPNGETNIFSAMRICYRKLISLELIGQGELALLDAWLADLADLGYTSANR
jgi:hypothetical protein